MNVSESEIFWIYLVVVWTANINDLIRGHWFYYSTQAVLFWNLFGVMALVGIILKYRERLKKCAK